MRVYKNWLHNILDTVSLLNLGLLSVATFYQLLNGQNAVLITMISTSVAICIFILIILYHGALRITLLRKVRSQLSTIIARTRRGGPEEVQLQGAWKQDSIEEQPKKIDYPYFY